MESRMETQTSQAQSKTCPLCNLEFSCVSAKNRHLKIIHNQELNTIAKKTHIICPLCTGKELVCGTYSKLEQHLKVNHKIELEMETHNFVTKESYEAWFETQRIETQYASTRLNRYSDYVEKSYTCNRSNLKGICKWYMPFLTILFNKTYFLFSGSSSNCSKRTEKAEGSIKIHGVCPSRLIIKIWNTGKFKGKLLYNIGIGPITHAGCMENMCTLCNVS